MRFIKLFEKFDDVDDDFGISNLYWSKATISLSIGAGTPVTGIDKIEKMIDDYKIMYARNKEWGGGPVNKEWIKKYYSEFKTSEDRAAHGWKPHIVLNIHTDKFGVIKLGFSLVTKTCYSHNGHAAGYKENCTNCDGTGQILPTMSCRVCSGYGKVDNEFYKSASKELYMHIDKEIFRKKMKFDDVILKYSLDVEDDFDYEPMEIKESINTNNSNSGEEIKKALGELSRELNHLKVLMRQQSERKDRAKILNMDSGKPCSIFSTPEGLSEDFREYFYDLTDDDWSIFINPSDWYYEINFRKELKTSVDAEDIFNKIAPICASINSALKSDGYNAHYQILFNNTTQSENNPVTRKNDIYKYKRFDILNNNEDTLRIKIRFIII